MTKKKFHATILLGNIDEIRKYENFDVDKLPKVEIYCWTYSYNNMLATVHREMSVKHHKKPYEYFVLRIDELSGAKMKAKQGKTKRMF